MIFPFYLVSVALAGGLLGVWVRRILVAAGLLSGFEPGLLVVAGVALAYAALQLAYLALVRFLKPTRSPGPVLFDLASQLAVLLLVPHLLHLVIPWPWPVMLKLEPVLYLGAFAATHGFLKILVFFSAMQSRPGGRLGALGLGGLAGAALMGTFTAHQMLIAGAWTNASVPAGEPQWLRSGDTWALARETREGLATVLPIAPGPGNELLLQCAPPDSDGDNTLDTAHASVVLLDAPGGRPLAPPTPLELALTPGGWAEARIPLEGAAAAAKALELQWTGKESAAWLRRVGLRPAVNSLNTLLVSGPWRITGGEAARRPSMVVIALEGAAAENMSLYGYERDTTPAIKAHAAPMWVFDQAFTPAPEPMAACMSLLTGVNPLRHGYLERNRGPLPAGVTPMAEQLRAQGYLTAAFTEGQGAEDNDLTPGSGFERGFLLFDDHCPLDPAPAGSGGAAPAAPLPGSVQTTLDKAGAWMEAHPDDPCFVFLRLRELRTPMRLSRYGEGFLGKGRTPSPMDIYDTVLLDIDKRVGAFLDQIAALPGADKRILCLTSLYGADFTEAGRGSWRRGGPGGRSLHESCLRIPLLIQAPEQAGRVRKVPATLCDVAPTLLALAGIPAPKGLDGADLLLQGEFRDCVSMMGSPLALSVRAGLWRFTWQTGLNPLSLQPAGDAAILEFTNVQHDRENKAPANYLAKEPELARQLQDDLAGYLQRRGAPQPTAAPAAR